MGGVKKRIKHFASSDIGQLAVPIVAGYAAGGLVGANTATGAAGNSQAVAGAAGAAAATATSGAITPAVPDPNLPPMPDLATPTDPSAVDRAARMRQKLAAMAGRGSTILTGGQTLGSAGTSGGKVLLGL